MAGSLELLVAETKEKERLEQELAIARQVQESLFPPRMPELPTAELAATCQPARSVSGDLYDVVELGKNRVGLLCADVAGKGISAALLVSSLQAIVRTTARPGASGPGSDRPTPTPSELVALLNSELSDRMPSNRFITLFWAEYDAEQRLLRYTNAGHNPPLLIQSESGAPVRLEEGGLPVGMFAAATYEERELKLAPGSLLAVYTDGIPEALNADQEEFGDQRWEALCKEYSSGRAEEFLTSSFGALREWVANSEQFDDMTLVVLKVV
jgi:sigma-B regulation protein RsbU (phosphoserine phosphatase)